MVSTRKKTYASVAETTRTQQKSILQEVAEVGASFNGQNEPAVLAAEGELQFGSLPPVDQHALRVAQGPRIHGSDLDELVATYENQDADDDEEERDESPTAGDSESGADAASSENVEDESAYILHSQGSLDWESSENGFVVPRITAKKYKWLVPERMDTKYKFFPTWFDLSEDEDQLGPIPGSWVKKEEVDFQSAIEASIEEVKISSAVPARSMAVIVEVPEEAAAKQSTKGKNVDAAERSTGFAAYLQEMQNSNAAREKHHKKSKDAKKAKERFSRSESQVPEGGWFRATTSKSGSPPAPPNTPSSSSDSSSSSDTSSSESAQSDPGSDTSSSGAYSGIRSRKLRNKLRDKRKLDEMRRLEGNEPWTPPDDNDKETSDTSTGRKTDKSAKNNQSAGKWAKDKQKEKSGKPKSFKPKWSPEEMDQMRAENKCFTCGEVGHQSRNCPDKHQAKAPKQKVSVGVARYDYLNSLGLDDLATSHRCTRIRSASKIPTSYPILRPWIKVPIKFG
ncbi:hypothetical protein B0H14DRAFT_3645240 [Mycena olivaceomarginata]|nr:hypothetical protein B0H14DRAFT_3645240 [Mycena olivaceomarginata]